MRRILGISISVLSVVIAIAVITYYGGGEGLVGSGWVLAILGAPTTLLDILISKFHNNFILDFIWICFFYTIQYQFIAFLILRKYKKPKIILLFSSILLIFITGYVMYYLCIGRYDMTRHSNAHYRYNPATNKEYK